MKIAVLGGGIAGMSSVMYLNQVYGEENITLFSTDLGGEYKKGGLKYIHFNKYTEKFFNDMMNIEYSIKRVNGLIHYVGSDLLYHEFPYFIKCHSKGEVVQRMYWNKTRGVVKNFDKRCMNNPHEKSYELKLEPKNGLVRMVGKLARFSDPFFQWKEINELNLQHIINNYDMVVYTIPFSIIAGTYNISFKRDYEKLYIFRLELDESEVNKIWWDYIYFPHANIPFHRVSKAGKFLDFEINSRNYDKSTYIDCIKSLASDANVGFKIRNFNSGKFYQMSIKGQISNDATQDMLNQIPNSVYLLGRYAQFNKRITFDMVLRYLENDFPIFYKRMKDEKQKRDVERTL